MIDCCIAGSWKLEVQFFSGPVLTSRKWIGNALEVHKQQTISEIMSHEYKTHLDQLRCKAGR